MLGMALTLLPQIFSSLQMNRMATVLTTPSKIVWEDDPALLYKVYVGFEQDKQGNITHLDIIDGWLRGTEGLLLKHHQTLENRISYFELEIVPTQKVNTYLRVPVDFPLMRTVLIKVFKQGVCTGYQWTDLNGNVLGWPKPAVLKTDAVKASV